ncbi:MAG: adenylyl-sulfate kinase [Candidatus Thorarchaeota archaeon]|jgi:adenylylsulfate kinase-like enzyme
MIIWITGLPGSGKTSLARELEDSKRFDFITVDGDVTRKYWPHSFSVGGRIDHVFHVQALAAFLHEERFDVVVAMISPFKLQRDTFKRDNDNVLEVYLTGRGHWDESYGKNVYEPPQEQCLTIDMKRTSIEEARDLVLREAAAYL